MRVAILALLPLALGVTPALSAESYDACTGFIDAVPAMISTQGTWCLRKDVATAITSGAAIEVRTNNVTLDCNGFKIGGLAAGPSTMTVGVLADARNNTTVRQCNIRGFRVGAQIDGSGHVVEHNRLEGNTEVGLWVTADGGLIRDNLLVDTGPAAQAGILAGGEADVIDNTVDTVVGNHLFNVGGIVALGGRSNVVAGNRVRGMINTHGEGITIGIVLGANGGTGVTSRTVARENVVIATPEEPGIGIHCMFATNLARDNEVSGWQVSGAQQIEGCTSVDNVVVP